MCCKINIKHADDLFQEVVLELLTMDETRLPEVGFLNFWFYRVAYNTMGKYGRLGFLLNHGGKLNTVPIDEVKRLKIPNNSENEGSRESLIREAEKFMLSLSEFENRVVMLYLHYGNMRKVERATGISYAALMEVKKKINEQRK